MKILIIKGNDPLRYPMFFPEELIGRLKTMGEVIYTERDRESVKKALNGVDVIFGMWGMPVLDEDLLADADSLKLVCYVCGSVADFMTEAVEKHGIRVLSANKLFANSVAEGTIAYILAAQRQLVKTMNTMEQTGWAPAIETAGIRYKTIGIIGFGMIARELSRMLQAFECTVKICSDYYHPEDEAVCKAKKCSLEEIFTTCDIVSIHESLRDDTYHLVNWEYLSKMKQGALLVNTARGPIVSEEDLVRASSKLGIRAILDVYEKEPLPMDSPLRSCPKILMMPHRGGPTMDLYPYCTKALIDDLALWNRRAGTDAQAEMLEHEIPWSYAQHMTHSLANIKH